jgi:hypothetical protein
MGDAQSVPSSAEHAAQIWAFRAGVSEEEAELNQSSDS